MNAAQFACELFAKALLGMGNSWGINMSTILGAPQGIKEHSMPKALHFSTVTLTLGVVAPVAVPLLPCPLLWCYSVFLAAVAFTDIISPF